MKYKVIELETEEVNLFNSLSDICDAYNLTTYEVWWLLNNRYLKKTKLFKRMQELTEKYLIFTNRISADIEDLMYIKEPEEIEIQKEIELVEKPKNIVKEYINQIETKIKNKTLES
jgi:hypothetical protein